MDRIMPEWIKGYIEALEADTAPLTRFRLHPGSLAVRTSRGTRARLELA